MTNQSGIYCITNTVNGNKYIGSAVNIRGRWATHLFRLRDKVHHSAHLQNAWNKYGEACFEFTVIELCYKGRLIEREQYYIDSEKPVYNLCQTAGNCLGIKHTEEAKRKMSEARMGHPVSEETKRKISESIKGEKHYMFGKHPAEETRAKLSEANKGERNPNFGKYASEETKRKSSESHKGKPNGRLGTHRTEETKRKLSEACRGRKLSDEHKRKLSERIASDETKRKISESLRKYLQEHPRVISEETRRKMSESARNRWLL